MKSLLSSELKKLATTPGPEHARRGCGNFRQCSSTGALCRPLSASLLASTWGIACRVRTQNQQARSALQRYMKIGVNKNKELRAPQCEKSSKSALSCGSRARRQQMIPARHPFRPRGSRVIQNPCTGSIPDRSGPRPSPDRRRNGPWNRERDPALSHFPYGSASFRRTPKPLPSLASITDSRSRNRPHGCSRARVGRRQFRSLPLAPMRSIRTCRKSSPSDSRTSPSPLGTRRRSA